jgi:hypothetical protein
MMHNDCQTGERIQREPRLYPHLDGELLDLMITVHLDHGEHRNWLLVGVDFRSTEYRCECQMAKWLTTNQGGAMETTPELRIAALC